MSQWSQVSRIALCLSKVKVSDSVTELVSQWQGHLLSCSGQLKKKMTQLQLALPQLRRLVLFRSSKTASYCWSVDRVLATSVKSLQDLRSSCHGACQEMAQIGGGFSPQKSPKQVLKKKCQKSDQRKSTWGLVARVKERVKRCTDCSLLISIFTSLLLHEENCTRGKWDWKRICSRVSDRSVSWYGREAEVYQTRPAAQERRQKGLRDARNSFWPWDKSWYRRSRHSSSHRYQPMWSLRFTDLTNHIRIVPDISRKRDVDMKLLKLVS